MGRLVDRRRATLYSFPFIGAVLALAVAAGLILQLQRVLVAQQQEVLQKLCEERVQRASSTAQRIFYEPFFDIVRPIRHPELKRYDLSYAADHFGTEAARQSYVQGFFLWHERFPEHLRREPLFYAPRQDVGEDAVFLVDNRERAAGSLVPERGPLPRLIFDTAQGLTSKRPLYSVSEQTVEGVRYQVVVHHFYHEPLATTLFGLVGYVVNLTDVEARLGAWLAAADLTGPVGTDERSATLRLTITDEHGDIVHGQEPSPGAIAASRPLEMLFFPAAATETEIILAPKRIWTLTVSADAQGAVLSLTDSWAALGAVLMIGLAGFCTVRAVGQVSRLSTMQAEFVASVSHQLRTPLSILSGVTETLSDGRITSEAKIKEYAGAAHVQTRRLSALVDRILIFSKSRELQEPATQVVNFAHLVRSSVQACLPEQGKGTVPVRTEIECGQLLVNGDAEALEQVVVNLVENAIKYGGGREIVVRVERDGANAVLSVQDHGMGIETSEVPRIFDKFYRGRSGAHRAPGFGLGLAIVREVVAAHRGRVSVSSQPGHGSLFRVVLPALQEEGNSGIPSPGR